MSEGDTLVNALIGAVVSVVAAALPLSPLLGGAVAGYLQGGDRSDGIRVGAIAGAITFVVGGLIVFLLFAFVGAFLIGMGPGGAPAALWVGFVLFLLVMSLAYTVGLSALGGWLGHYLRAETDLGS